MGFFKQVKDMKNMVHEAPGLIDQSNQLRANAEAAAAAQEAAATAAGGSVAAAGVPAPTDGDLAPIAGVTLEAYASVSRSFAEVGYDQSKGHELAARQGIAPADWDAALAGWNARIQADPAVASRFNALYTGR